MSNKNRKIVDLREDEVKVSPADEAEETEDMEETEKKAERKVKKIKKAAKPAVKEETPMWKKIVGGIGAGALFVGGCVGSFFLGRSSAKKRHDLPKRDDAPGVPDFTTFGGNHSGFTAPETKTDVTVDKF